MQSAVSTFHIISTDILSLYLTTVALPSRNHRFPVTQFFQLQIYSAVQLHLWHLRNGTKLSYLPSVKGLVSSNRQTCSPILDILLGTHNSLEMSVMYLIDFIILYHLQLMNTLYELFLKIIKAHGTS